MPSRFCRFDGSEYPAAFLAASIRACISGEGGVGEAGALVDEETTEVDERRFWERDVAVTGEDFALVRRRLVAAISKRLNFLLADS